MADTVLSREMIEAGGIDLLVAREAPDLVLLTEDERRASLRTTLAARPAGDVWVFAYGSLIWNPTIRSIERRTARIVGWHRSFCLSAKAGRGTAENPGLVLGLDEGGDCRGVAFRIAEEAAEEELALLWRREMLSAAYRPQWLDLHDGRDVPFGRGIAFLIDRSTTHYAGDLGEAAMLHRLATAAGALGSSADYLFRTCEGLRSHGIPDPDLERLARCVHDLQQPWRR